MHIDEQTKRQIRAFTTQVHNQAEQFDRDETGRVMGADEQGGEYKDFVLADGVFLCLDWIYLREPATYILIPKDRVRYNRSTERQLSNVGPHFERLLDELETVLPHDGAEFDHDARHSASDKYYLQNAIPWYR